KGLRSIRHSQRPACEASLGGNGGGGFSARQTRFASTRDGLPYAAGPFESDEVAAFAASRKASQTCSSTAGCLRKSAIPVVRPAPYPTQRKHADAHRDPRPDCAARCHTEFPTCADATYRPHPGRLSIRLSPRSI